MRLFLTERFQSGYANAPTLVQKAADKQLRLLVHNLHHPSLHAKKYNETTDVWQARVNRGWRLYFTIDGDMYIIRNLLPHPK